MDIRDNVLAQAPYLAAKANPRYLANAGTGQAPKPVPVEIGSFSQEVQDAHARPLVGSREADNAVIGWNIKTLLRSVCACKASSPRLRRYIGASDEAVAFA